jgi:hypothetical protein
MAKKHGYQLCPAGKPFGSTFRSMLGDQMGKFCTGKVMKKLTKQTRYLYHEHALFGGCAEKFVGAKILQHNLPGGHLFKILFWTRVSLFNF